MSASGSTTTSSADRATTADRLARVAVGGAIGTLVRHAALSTTSDTADQWTLLAINGVGSLIIGILAARRLRPERWALAATGFCGGLTSFSTFCLAVARSLDAGDPLQATGNVLATTGIAVGAVGIGTIIGKRRGTERPL